jgi:hypothetical protein
MALLATDPIDILLDPNTGDMLLDANNSPQLSRGLPAVAQGIRIAVGMFRGEWFLNLLTGMPYFQSILGKRYNNAQIRALYRDAILKVPGVARLASLTATFDRPTRNVTVTWEAVAVFGGTVTDSLSFQVAT